jgi:hypothetical protein
VEHPGGILLVKMGMHSAIQTSKTASQHTTLSEIADTTGNTTALDVICAQSSEPQTAFLGIYIQSWKMGRVQ